MNLTKYFLMSLPVLGASLIAGDIYVNSSFNGVSTGSKAAPFTTIQSAANVAQEGDTIWLYGSDEVSYVFETDVSAVVFNPDNLHLRGYTNDGEATDWYETNKMAKVFIPDGYAKNSFEEDQKTDRPFTVNGANMKISGVYFDFGGKSFKQQNYGGDNLIVVTNTNFCVENSYFYMSSTAGYSASSTPISGIDIDKSPSRDMVFNRCAFVYTDCYRDYNTPITCCDGLLTAKNCYFELANRFATGSNKVRTSICVVSNIFYNCLSSGQKENEDYVAALFSKGGNYYPVNAEITYNRIIRDDYDSKWGTMPYYLLVHGGMYGGSFTQDVKIHHNTIVGADRAFITRRRLKGNEDADVWTPEIHNNIILLSEGGELIREYEGSVLGQKFYKDYTTSYKLGSFIRNNALMYDTFLTGDATTNSWYKLEYEEGVDCGVVIQDNFDLTGIPKFVNTTDPTNKDFYRLRLDDNQWVRQNSWRGENNEYPRYIGALEPLLPLCSLLIVK
ncbi:MAG: hypothetical protein J6V41_06685 [Kiritimatiellae bacterium]|nr:hypothetical protein [Kiritimatiellia bacterium]